MFGISGPEFIVLLAVAAIVLGPERLPQYTQQLARFVRQMRVMAAGATQQVRAELGPEFDDVDWRKLDPRQYDPRRIVREALADTFDPNDPLGLNSPPTTSGHLNERGAAPSVNGSSGSTSAEPSGGASSGPRFDPDAT